MNYRHIVQGEFLERPNRFIAYVSIHGRREKVHVKNTGRCKELLQKGVTVYLEKSENPNRRTAYDLVAVEKGSRLINIDSQAPNKVVEEWLYTKALFPDLQLIRPETRYGNSRFDFYVETSDEKIFIEVKGVTLEDKGVVSFPDAPSERAVKHVEELIRAHQDGYRTLVLFVVQMEQVDCFVPNDETHAAFGQVLRKANEAGVEIMAYDCRVKPDALQIRDVVPVLLKKDNKILSKFKTNLRIGELLGIPKPLLKWYDNKKRILPWREKPTPYRVWISEIMLQQTRVEAVKPYFERFMKALPDVRTLAYAKEEELLKLWEGLGYYNRVRNLQKAALQIMEEYGGDMPADYDKLLSLKGIGSYTAGAVSSIAFGKVHPAVDGNVLRVIARVRKDDRSFSQAKVKASIEQDVLAIMPKDRPGDFNQAMMELGACVCIPNGAPHCEECPLAELCMAHQDGTELAYPKKDKARQRSIVEKTILIIRDGEKTAIRKRTQKGLLAGMYEFPSVDSYLSADEVASYLTANGLSPIRITPLEDAKHIFTHKEWHMKGYMVRVDELEPANPTGESRDWLYIEPDRVQEKYPLPAAFAAYTRYLNIKLGNEKYREES